VASIFQELPVTAQGAKPAAHCLGPAATGPPAGSGWLPRLGLLLMPVFSSGGALALICAGSRLSAIWPGFVPAGWLTAAFAARRGWAICCACWGRLMGLLVIQLSGIANLLIGGLAGRLGDSLGIC